MSEVIKIRKGFNINLLGEAEKTITEIHPKKCAIKPVNFIGAFPKLLVKEGDPVKAGSPLFLDKYRDNIVFTAPVSGTVTSLRRGEKRVLLEIEVTSDGRDGSIDFGKADPNSLTRDEVVRKLLASGTWPLIRQRPYSIIADPAVDPKGIFISAFDTAPLAPDQDLIVHGLGEPFQAGLNALLKLTSGTVHLNISANPGTSKVFLNAKGVKVNRFAGKHPAGNIGTQVAFLDPINKGDQIWYLRPQEVIQIGRLFLTGKVDATRTIAVTGSEVTKPRYVRTRLGSNLEDLIGDTARPGKLRYVSGNPLTGTRVEKYGFVNFYDSQVTVLPEGDYHEFFGWAAPGFNKLSFSRTFFSAFSPKKHFRADTNYHGAERAYVMTGKFEQVFGWDLYPLQIIKAALAEDIDMMEKLGIYEVDEEDFALCEFIDTSKTEIQQIIRQGLDLMRKEMS
jgi:Na+-transporting NADH:ubiquinone oxidoreductase subunit A